MQKISFRTKIYFNIAIEIKIYIFLFLKILILILKTNLKQHIYVLTIMIFRFYLKKIDICNISAMINYQIGTNVIFKIQKEETFIIFLQVSVTVRVTVYSLLGNIFLIKIKTIF